MENLTGPYEQLYCKTTTALPDVFTDMHTSLRVTTVTIDSTSVIYFHL